MLADTSLFQHHRSRACQAFLDQMPQASIVIVTRNRKQMARVAVESALSQDGDIEVIVIDDASTDGTAEYIRHHCPRALVDRVPQRTGYIVQRSRAAELASSPFLVSIDDDAYFLDTKAVLDSIALFDDPRVGAVAIPFVNKRADGSDEVVLAPAPADGKVHLVNTFVGTAYVVRRDVFRQLGGFNGYLFHWGEEAEYCQRLLNAGYLVRLGTRILIRHCPGWAGKYTREVNSYVGRNRLLITWLNAPGAYLLPLLAIQAALTLKEMLRARDRIAVLLGLRNGFFAMFGARGQRRGISRRAFKLYLYLRKNRGATPESIDSSLLPA